MNWKAKNLGTVLFVLREERKEPSLKFLIKVQKVEADFFAKFPVYLAVNDMYKHFAGSADNRPVQMTSDYLVFLVSGAHMNVVV